MKVLSLRVSLTNRRRMIGMVSRVIGYWCTLAGGSPVSTESVFSLKLKKFIFGERGARNVIMNMQSQLEGFRMEQAAAMTTVWRQND